MGHLVTVIIAVVNSLSCFFSARREGRDSSLLYLKILEALLRGVGGRRSQFASSALDNKMLQ